VNWKMLEGDVGGLGDGREVVDGVLGGKKKEETVKSMDINMANEKLGNQRNNTLKATLQYWGYKATGNLDPCNGCLKEKARAKDVSHKPTLNEATEPGKRLLLDTTGPFEMSA
jgi:hypothetical protein